MSGTVLVTEDAVLKDEKQMIMQITIQLVQWWAKGVK